MTGVLLLLLLLGAIALSLWAIVDASLQPQTAYAASGVSRPGTTALLLLTCAVGAVVYAIVLRPRLLRARGAHGR